MKYQCNSCGKVHDYRSDAVNCHPDINEIPDEQLESRLAAQQIARLTRFPQCNGCEYNPCDLENNSDYCPARR